MARNVSRWGRRRKKLRNNRVTIRRARCDGPTRRAMFEVLEERAMLTVAQDLQNLIAPYQTAVNNALAVATSLPLVGHQLTVLQNLNTLLQNSLSKYRDDVGYLHDQGWF